MDDLIIKIDWPYFLGILGSLMMIAWYTSGKFSKTETLLGSVDKRLTNLEGKLYGTFQSQSPISLTDVGNKFLKESGLKDYIDFNKEKLFSDCHKLKKISTAYDIQEVAFAFFDTVKFETGFEKKLENFTYQQGIDLKILRRIGGIYLRNLLIKKLGMNEKDIGKTK